jgi:hypothetical protein
MIKRSTVKAALAFKTSLGNNSLRSFAASNGPHQGGSGHHGRPGTHSHPKDKEIKLSPQLEQQYQQSALGKIPEVIKPKDVNNAMKSIFVFKDYLIPNKRVDPVFSTLIKKSYFFLVLSKVS